MKNKRFTPSKSPNGDPIAKGTEEARRRVVALLPRDERGILPLCYTIGEQLCNGLRDLDPELIRLVLREVTLEAGYLNRIITDKWRHSLNGEPIEPIRRYQREFASGLLALRADWERNNQ